ncbi:MAG: hypothetical protein EOM69_03275 [Clostridia bacterium]|nr:hypothetical protein [Clostridia bacterium]
MMQLTELQKIMNEVGQLAKKQQPSIPGDAAATPAGIVQQTNARAAAQSTGQSGDIGALMQQAMAAGASASEVQELVNKRVQKAMSDSSLNKYAYDGLYQQANDYIKTKQNKDLINQMYEQQKEADIAAIREAIRAGIANIQSGVQSALPQYDAMNKQSEAQRYATQRALAEQLANTGDKSTGGLSGMGRGDVLSVENAGAERLGSIALQKQQMLDDAQRSMAELERSGSLQEAQAAASANQARLAALLQEQNEQWSRQQQQSQFDYQREQDAYDRKTAAEQYDYNKKLQQAETLGAYGDFSGYRELGYSDAQISAMQSRYQAQLLAKASSGSGSGRSKKESGASGGSLYADMEASGDPYTYLMTNYKDYGVAYSGLGGVWEQYQKQAGTDDAVKRLAQMAWNAAGSSGSVQDPNVGKRLQAYMQERIMSGTVSKEVAAAALKKLGFDVE